MATFQSALSATLIYVIAIEDGRHDRCLKIGQTTLSEDVDPLATPPNCEVLNAAARARVDGYTRTAGIAYELLHTELTLCMQGGKLCTFNDSQVHSILSRSGVKRRELRGAKEWFSCDLDTVKRAIAAAKRGETSLAPGGVTQETINPIILRPEQRRAVDQTLRQFRKGKQMLWNAKMRFGKTLCALRVAREMEAKRTIIVTHRPVVDESWFEDFMKTFHDRPDFRYGSRGKGHSLQALQRFARGKGHHAIYFASLQDMRGSKGVGGKYDKNHEVFSAEWDLVIVDEAHEGTQTELGRAVIGALVGKKSRLLRLSGTPFNLLEGLQEEEVFTWDYVMEQRAKREWELSNLGDANPYAGLPTINIYTYDLGALLDEYGDGERAFNFREFFRAREDGLFAHEGDVDAFLNLLCQESQSALYPYSNERFRDIFRHTLWVLPGVKAARALSRKLARHSVFGAFDVVNVAGDGDGLEDEENRDALSLVMARIGNDPDATRTITLSCGRLTTGVSVPPWTGVFLMAGGYSTSAASYMQTIFRVQTPFTHRGRMKTDCYAFDFAPDRTLRVLAETARLSAGRDEPLGEERRVLGEFLNFCPIIAIAGGRMKPYDLNGMLGQLKRARVERVVRCGFEDGALYNDGLMRLTDEELSAFRELKGIIGQTPAMPRPDDIPLNRQGLTDEQRAELQGLQNKDKKRLTAEERARLEELKALGAQRKTAISILRGISIRMPLMLYGAEIVDEERELSIENFTHLVDDASWEEFMPRGVSKQLFQQFVRFYDPDVFREAGKRIRAMVRSADRFTIEERIARVADIFSTFRNPDKETVLTPWRVVNIHMGRALGGHCFMDENFELPLETPRPLECDGVTRALFHRESTLLDINSKSGLYPLYAAYSIYRARLENAREKYGEVPHATAMLLWDETLRDNIFAVCKTPMARSITRRTLAGFRNTTVRTEYYPNLIEHLKSEPERVADTLSNAGKFWGIKKEVIMKFDAVIGNPPYQLSAENTSDNPVYHHFVDLAARLAPRVSLITPARYLFNAGKTPKEWNGKMLRDPHLRVVFYWPSSAEVFPSVEIKGGVAVTYRDQGQEFGPIGTFTVYPELTAIAKKVKYPIGSLVEIIHQQNKFDLEKLYRDYPEAKEIVGSSGRERRLTTPIFTQLSLFSKKDTGGCYKILGLIANARCYRWIKRCYIEEHPNLEKYKVIVPKSNGSGAIGEVLSTPLIGEPLIGVTQTFLTIGAFNTEGEAAACLKYVKSKFARTMLGILKATQHNPRDTWRLVPLQDFTPASDINWEGSVADIDRQLFSKYGLSAEEVAFIEARVQAME